MTVTAERVRELLDYDPETGLLRWRVSRGSVAAGTAVCYVNSVTPIGGALGDLAVMNVSWPTSGTVAGWGL